MVSFCLDLFRVLLLNVLHILIVDVCAFIGHFFSIGVNSDSVW